MTPERWRQIEEILENALDLDAEARRDLIDASCEDDPALKAEVEELLAADDDPLELLEQHAASFAGPAWKEDVLPVSALPSPLESEFGSYRLLREIGRGGMSRVFLAERVDDRLERRAAIKILHPSHRNRYELERRFHAEGLVLASLSHPNIAQVFDAGVDDQGRPFLIMEYIEGDPITEHCSTTRCSIDECLSLFLEVCSAVQHAHQRLVVHRDLKPSNILVDRVRKVKLLDFGIAKLLAARNGTTSEVLTRTGVLPMTPEYAAPEQIQAGEITTATDVYALGLLLYELLTGSRAYRLDGRTPSEIEQVICYVEPRRPSVVGLEQGDREGRELSKSLRGDLDTIALKALCKEPSIRYGSAEALAQDVVRYREGLPIEARAPSVRYRALRFVQRHRLGVAFALLVFLGLVGFAATMAWQQEQTALERDRTRVERDKAEHLGDFLLGLFAASDPSEALGEETTAKQLLERGVERISEMDEKPELQARMLDVLGTVYGNLGNLEQARGLLERAIEIEIERSPAGEDTLDLADMRDHLAAVLIQQSEYEAAESLWRSVLETRRRLLGPLHVDVASSLNNLGVALQEGGKAAAAEAPHREALDLRRKVLGNEHPDVAESLINLGNLLHEVGRYEESETLLRESLHTLRAAYGFVHPRIADADNSLANLLARVGRHAEAEPLMRESLELRRQVFGNNHHLVAKSLNDLAVLLQNRGDFQASTPVFEEALRSYELLLGSDHLAVAIVGNNLGRVLVLEGRFERAAARFRSSLEIAERALGPNNWIASKSLTGIGAALDGQNDHAAAEIRYRQAVTMARQVLASDHPQLATPLLELGRLLVKEGRSSEAQASLHEAREILVAAFGRDHASSARADMWLGVCLMDLGEPEEGAALVTEAHEVQRELLSPSHPHRLETERAMARLRVTDLTRG